MSNAGHARTQLLHAGFGVVVEETDAADRGPDGETIWWASLTSRETGEIARKHYGHGATPDDAVIDAWERYETDEGG